MVTWGGESVRIFNNTNNANSTNTSSAPNTTTPTTATNTNANAATSAPSAFSFGSTAPATPSGASTAGAPSAFSFGPKTTTPSTPSGGTGAATSSTSAFSFGPTTTTTTPTTPSGTGNTAGSAFSFGSTTTTPTTASPSLFGGNTLNAGSTPFHSNVNFNLNTPQQVAAQAGQRAQQQQERERIMAALESLYKAYANQGGEFAHVFFREEGPSEANLHAPPLVPPPSNVISPTKWSLALASHPGLAPELIQGSQALAARIGAQQTKARQLAEHASSLQNAVDLLLQRSRTSRRRAEVLRERNATEVSRKRILEVLRKVEGLRCAGLPVQTAERDLELTLRAAMDRVRTLSAALQATTTLAGKVMEARVAAASAETTHKDDATASILTPEQRVELQSALEQQNLGHRTVIELMKKDFRDLRIVQDHLDKVHRP